VYGVARYFKDVTVHARVVPVDGQSSHRRKTKSAAPPGCVISGQAADRDNRLRHWHRQQSNCCEGRSTARFRIVARRRKSPPIESAGKALAIHSTACQLDETGMTTREPAAPAHVLGQPAFESEGIAEGGVPIDSSKCPRALVVGETAAEVPAAQTPNVGGGAHHYGGLF